MNGHRFNTKTRVVTFRSMDKAGFNDDCRQAYLEKQETFNLWRRNRSDLTWNNSVRLRSAAQEVYGLAEREYNRGVKETLENATQSHKWWSILNLPYLVLMMVCHRFSRWVSYLLS